MCDRKRCCKKYVRCEYPRRGPTGPTGPGGSGSDYIWRIATTNVGPTSTGPFTFGPVDVNNNDLVVFSSNGGVFFQVTEE